MSSLDKCILNITSEQAGILAEQVRNSIRRQLEDKGSLEKYRAALVKHHKAYDLLTEAEKQDPKNIRLSTLISELSKRIGYIEANVPRRHRRCRSGNYNLSWYEKIGGVIIDTYWKIRTHNLTKPKP